MQNQTDLYSVAKTYSAIDFVIGLFITLGASIVNALGLNITKLDFTRQEALPASSRRADWKRPFWWLGLLLYIASQLVGSTFALEYLRAEYVAPLGSTSLIFNFIFAYLLVGTPVTRTDIIGTFTIVLGVVGVVLFGNNRAPTDFDKESNLSLSILKEIWGRSDWIAYLTCLEVTTLALFWWSGIVHEVTMGRVEDDRGGESEEREDGIEGMVGHRQKFVPSDGLVGKVVGGWRKVMKLHQTSRRWVKRKVEGLSQSRSDVTLRKVAGLSWSVTGGMLAGQTLVLAKSCVKLVTSAINKTDPTESNVFTSPLTWVILILLVVAAFSQVYCLNASLKCYDSTFTVPIFFATYTTCGFINSLVYLDEFHTYQLWVFLCIWASIAVLIAGVALLSLKKPVARPRASSISREEGDEQDDTRLNPLGTPSPAEEREGGKGQGWLGKYVPPLDGNNGKQRDEESARGDVDSIFEEGGKDGSVAEELEMSTFDARGCGRDGSGTVFDAENEGVRDGDVFGEDEFGDFKEASGN